MDNNRTFRNLLLFLGGIGILLFAIVTMAIHVTGTAMQARVDEELRIGKGITVCASGGDDSTDENMMIGMHTVIGDERMLLQLKRRGDSWCADVPSSQIGRLQVVRFHDTVRLMDQLWISRILSPADRLVELRFERGVTETVLFRGAESPRIINLDEAAGTNPTN